LRPGVYLRLGRVSNLPTVWTNVLAGAVLAGGDVRPTTLAALCAIASLFYTAGMFLNDAFDREIDARERPERPIPAGEISAAEVFAIGFGMLAAGIWLLSRFGGHASLAGLALAGAIVLYDAWHKRNPLSPVIMGACRALVYVVAAVATTGRLPPAAIAGAVALWAYIVGLTVVARRRPPWLTVSVPTLLAGICLLDATMMAVEGRIALPLAAVGCFFLTRSLQRFIAGD
jgi:4-hydroxybenzoate polyprenyltransferase